MSIIPLYFISLDMAQASTSGTAILRTGRNGVGGGGVFLLTDRLNQIQEKTPLLQISSHLPSRSAPSKSSTANCAREMNVRMELIRIR